MIDRHLKSLLIEAPLIIKGFVKDDPACNYEIYLTEMLNASEWAKQHYRAPFVRPTSESNGECDAYSGAYGVDFKLIASKTALQARSIHWMQIWNCDDGSTVFGGSKVDSSMTVTRLPQALRGKSVEELLSIQKHAGKQQGVENDIKEYMQTISTPKNLLLFLPYRYSFDTIEDVDNDCREIAAAVSNDFAPSLRYRKLLYPEHDTFFVFMYDYVFAFCQWCNDRLVFIETVPIESSRTFMHLSQKYGEDWSEKYDVILKQIREKRCKPN